LRALGRFPSFSFATWKEVSWSMEVAPSGLYFRDDPRQLSENVREVALLGEQAGKEDVEERWLLFST
jgi:hypothetical protein